MVMALDARQQETAGAFDAVADSYDRTNRQNPILADMRARALSTLRRHVPPGAEVLDAGCGPGTDLPMLIAAGYCVTGIDASPGMVARASARADFADGSPRPTVLCRSLEQLGKFQPQSFDAVFSNFGALNCAADLASTARAFRDLLRPGGVIVASVIGRHCPWELGLYLCQARLGRALIRYRRRMVQVALGEGRVWMRYLTPREFGRVFTGAGFLTVDVSGLGVVAPPPYLEHLARRHPSLVRRLLAWDRVAGRWPVFREAGDHFLIVMRRD